MAFVEHDGAHIHWHALGKGEPLVLIMGLGCCSTMWFRLAPRLARKHRVIMLDNRGAGQTQVRFGLVHRVRTMAADVCAVLDAAGESSAHVLGLSMGGMIAQEFALDFPSRLRSLMLLATNCGGAFAVQPQTHVWQLLFTAANVAPEQALESLRPYTYAEATPPERIDEDTVLRLANYPTLRGYQAQLFGLIGWSSYIRLTQLERPTLIMHGKEDELIPPENGRVLASRIAGSTLVELDDASHWLHTDQPERTAKAVQEFVAAHAGAPR